MPCMESACSQTYANLEIVVVNDGSTDNSPGILRSFAEKDARVVIVDKKNEGLMLARRDGILRSTGELIFWLDGDDYLSLDCIARLYDAAVANGCDIASAQRVRVRRDYVSSDGFVTPGLRDNREFIKILLLHEHVTVGGKLYRRDLWEGLCYHEEIGLGEDFVLNLELALGRYAPSIVFVEDAFYFYVQRPGSMIRHRDNFGYLEIFMGRVAEITDGVKGRCAALDVEIIAERALRFYVYIKKSRNEWCGDTALYNDVRREVVSVEKELRKLLPATVVESVLLYKYKRRKLLVNLLAAFRRIRHSIRRRSLAFDYSGVLLPASAKLPERTGLKRT